MESEAVREENSEDIKAAIAAERRELADMLDGLPAEQWDAPTLCAGWRVRDVVAHMSMGFRYSLPKMAAELLRAGGNLHRMTDRCARRDAAAASTSELAGFLREHAHHPWKPPVGGIAAALGHDVVHGLDITVALGPRPARARGPGAPPPGRRSPPGRPGSSAPTSAASSSAPTTSTGPSAADTPLSGAAQDLLLVAYGRKLPPGRLHGERHQRFVAG